MNMTFRVMSAIGVYLELTSLLIIINIDASVSITILLDLVDLAFFKVDQA